jgi:hypothetical protein
MTTKQELLTLADEISLYGYGDDCQQVMTQASAALREFAGTMDAEPVAWEFRWTNPGNQTLQPDEMLEWKPIEHPNWQTLQEKIDDLEAYRYGGKPCYEMRKLYAHPPAPQRKPLTDEKILTALGIDGSDDWTFTVARAIEAAHGITAKPDAKQDSPQTSHAPRSTS